MWSNYFALYCEKRFSGCLPIILKQLIEVTSARWNTTSLCSVILKWNLHYQVHGEIYYTCVIICISVNIYNIWRHLYHYEAHYILCSSIWYTTPYLQCSSILLWDTLHQVFVYITVKHHMELTVHGETRYQSVSIFTSAGVVTPARLDHLYCELSAVMNYHQPLM